MTATMLETGHLPWLEAHLCRNKFMPTPPKELTFCGDGDYRAIGAEFLGHFVRLGELQPHERILDIGCGIGRMAVPLTQFLSNEGCYTGIDIVRDGISWCNQAIASVYPNFSFQHLDVHHPLYNPDGQSSGKAIRFPFADKSFDFICLVSVLTHIDQDVLVNYAKEIARLLVPGGRCFATAFLVNPPARDALQTGKGRLAFDPSSEELELYADSQAPMAAVAFEENFFLEKFLRYGLKRIRPAAYGCWSGRVSTVFQDICIFEQG